MSSLGEKPSGRCEPMSNEQNPRSTAERDLSYLAKWTVKLDAYRREPGEFADQSAERRQAEARCEEIRAKLLKLSRADQLTLDFVFMRHGKEAREKRDIAALLARELANPAQRAVIAAGGEDGKDIASILAARARRAIEAAIAAYEGREPDPIGYQPRHLRRDRFVYFIQRVDGTGPIKIGVADDVPRRLGGIQTSHPEPLHVLAVMRGGVSMERSLHERFASLRMQGEWFRPEPDLLAFIEVVREKEGRKR